MWKLKKLITCIKNTQQILLDSTTYLSIYYDWK